MFKPITAAALSQIEAGKVRPTVSTLRDLAEALAVPYEFFLVQWPGMSSSTPPTAFFRDLRSTSVRERRRAQAMAILLSDLVAALEVHVRLPEVQIPARPLRSDEGPDEVDRVVDTLRSEWRLGTGPIPHVVRELERRGVPIARLAFADERVDAFSVAFDRRPLILLTEAKSNYVRSRFDAAHELAHLVLHRDTESGSRTAEREAHDFASSFLLPHAAAVEELPRKLDPTGWARVADMKGRWGISIAALLFRARALRVLSEHDYRNAIKYMSARGWRTAEPGDREMGPPEAPLLIERAVRTVEVLLGKPIEGLLEAAGLPIGDMMDLIRVAVDRRPTVEF
jgi:Zn-dependent peptidase ImmA (M78 family)